MGFSKLFIDRPILAGVISVMIMLVGAVAYFALPVSQYPEVAPPSITVTASYPGANAETAAATVAAPLEQEINGVERMLYLSSQSTADGRTTITVTFALGTDLDAAQVLVQNRVNIALPRLPEDVRRLGVVTNKNTPDILMVVHIYSPDGIARSVVSVELHAAQHPRPAGQARWRRRSAACSARANTRCASGSIRTGSPRWA